MSASEIKVEPKDVTQAGVDMGAAANTTSEVLGVISAATQPITHATLGTPALGVAFDNFWHSFRQQQQLSHDVLAELGKKLGGAAVKINNTDTGNANGMNKVGTNAPPTTTTPATTPVSSTPGGDNNPPPVSSAPPPPDSSTPPDSTDPGGDGTASAPGSATPTSSTTSTSADTAAAAAFAVIPGV
jgi:uncharacterized protein YukE